MHMYGEAGEKLPGRETFTLLTRSMTSPRRAHSHPLEVHEAGVQGSLSKERRHVRESRGYADTG